MGCGCNKSANKLKELVNQAKANASSNIKPQMPAVNRMRQGNSVSPTPQVPLTRRQARIQARSERIQARNERMAARNAVLVAQKNN